MALFAATLLGWVAGPAQPSDDFIPEAVEFMQVYSRLENAFDPAFADLVSDRARIVSRSEEGPLTIPAPQFKQLLHSEMLLGALQPYSISYRITSTRWEDRRIRIEVIRRTEPLNVEGPQSLLIGQDADERWRVFEKIEH